MNSTQAEGGRLQTKWRHAFTLVELLVVLVILSVVLLIAALSISRIRSRATSVTSESNLRQLGVLVVAYSQDFREMPPTVFAPIEQFMSRLDPPQAVQTPHGVARGYWFSNSLEFAAVLDNVPPARIRRDASMPRGLAETGIDGFDTDFKISDTLYATPEYWNRITQRGIEQWFPMQLSLDRFHWFSSAFGACQVARSLIVV